MDPITYLRRKLEIKTKCLEKVDGTSVQAAGRRLELSTQIELIDEIITDLKLIAAEEEERHERKPVHKKPPDAFWVGAQTPVDAPRAEWLTAKHVGPTEVHVLTEMVLSAMKRECSVKVRELSPETIKVFQDENYMVKRLHPDGHEVVWCPTRQTKP